MREETITTDFLQISTHHSSLQDLEIVFIALRNVRSILHWIERPPSRSGAERLGGLELGQLQLPDSECGWGEWSRTWVRIIQEASACEDVQNEKQIEYISCCSIQDTSGVKEEKHTLMSLCLLLWENLPFTSGCGLFVKG